MVELPWLLGQGKVRQIFCVLNTSGIVCQLSSQGVTTTVVKGLGRLLRERKKRVVRPVNLTENAIVAGANVR
jgi:hypothetical protein